MAKPKYNKKGEIHVYEKQKGENGCASIIGWAVVIVVALVALNMCTSGT